MLLKKPAGWRAMDRKHDAMVLRIGKPFAAFSMMALHTNRNRQFSFLFLSLSLSQIKTIEAHPSITVITGHVNAPAVAALATSTPNRAPNRSVFQVLAEACNGRSEIADMVVRDES